MLFLGHKQHTELNQLISESYALLIDTKQDNNMVSIPESIVSGTAILTNTTPTNTQMIIDNKLGIVKDNWNENDILNIINNNIEYTTNCIKYRNKLSTTNSANLLIDCFFNNEK